MPGYVPHLLLRSDEGFSPIALSLRDAGYMVTKMKDDASLLVALTREAVDGVILELPAVATIRCMRTMQQHASHVPMLVATAAPEVVRRAVPTSSAELFDIREFDGDVVSATDLMLARGMGVQMQHAS